MIETGTILQQRYRIDRQIGQGGMGAVYIATDERFNSTVAIKETLCFSDENFRKAIEREARLLNSLKHSALPRVSDHFEEQNGQFLVMEYIPGEDVAAILESEGKPFPVDMVLKWADQLLDALDYLHNQEMPVVHRDIKPQNLKINARGEIILLDFGLAKGNPTDAGHLTAAKSIFGYSRNYASLEQIQGTGTDPRSDLYSLAATLYHLLTNSPPEDALTRAMSVLSKKADPLVPASSVNPAVPRGVAGVLQKALDLNAGERPSTAAEMRQMLRKSEEFAYLADTAIAAGHVFDPHVSAQPTRLMPDKTRIGAGLETGIKTEIFATDLSQATSIRAPQTNPDGSEGRKRRSRRSLTLAGALSVLLVGGAIAGAVYIAEPSVFGAAEVRDRQQAEVPAVVEAPPSPDANSSTLTVDTLVEAGPEIISTDAPAPAPADRRPVDKPEETAARSVNKNTRGSKNSINGSQGDVLDIQVDDPEIPEGGVVIAEKGSDGKIHFLRVNPKTPGTRSSPPASSNFFPNGFDFRTLKPEQQRKLEQIWREKQQTKLPAAPPPQPKP